MTHAESRNMEVKLPKQKPSWKLATSLGVLNYSATTSTRFPIRRCEGVPYKTCTNFWSIDGLHCIHTASFRWIMERKITLWAWHVTTTCMLVPVCFWWAKRLPKYILVLQTNEHAVRCTLSMTGSKGHIPRALVFYPTGDRGMMVEHFRSLWNLPIYRESLFYAVAIEKCNENEIRSKLQDTRKRRKATVQSNRARDLFQLKPTDVSRHSHLTTSYQKIWPYTILWL